MAVTYGSTAGQSGNGNTVTLGFAPGAGTGSCLFLGMSWNASPGAITVCTWNGVSLILLGDVAAAAAGCFTAIWGLASALMDGASHNLIVTWTNSVNYQVRVRAYYGASPVTALAFTGATGNGAASGAPTVSIVSRSSALVADHLVSSEAHEAGPGQTERYGNHDGPITHGSDEPGTTTTVMSWTLTSGGWTLYGCSINPPGGGNAMWWFSSRKWKHFLEDLKRGLLVPDVLKRRWGHLVRAI